MYDWANSVHSLSVATALFPMYWSIMTNEGKDMVPILGFNFKASSLYAFSLSFAFLVIAIVNPLLSGIADNKGNKKSYMRFFVFVGGLSCITMYFFTENTITLGLSTLIISTIGFAGSLVFYNAYLPEIAEPHEFDKLSARGFALGYVGCVILLIVNLVMISYYDVIGLESKLHAIRVSFATVGFWWIGFSFIPLSILPNNTKVSVKTSIWNGYMRSLGVLKKVWANKPTRTFLGSFFFYAMGVQTVMYMAALFGKEELNIPTDKLIMTILLIQLLGIVGAYFYAFISSRIGGTKTLISIMFIWILVCVFAYHTHTLQQFYGIAIMVGFVMGGVQSLSRSTFTKFLPKEEEHSAYYSFYELTEKVAIVLGTLCYGLIDQITGSMRQSVVALIIFFVIGMAGLFVLNAVMNKANRAY